MSYEQWVNVFLWDGLFFSLIAYSVMDLGEAGAACASKFFGIGLPFVFIGSSIKALQYWTGYHARLAIQGDYSMYVAMWDSLLSDQESLAAIEEMEELVAGPAGVDAADSAAAPRKAPGPPPVRQEIMARNERTGSFYDALTRVEETDMQTQLARLYADAENADGLFRPWVLELARRSGGMLRATAEHQAACAARGGIGDGGLVDGKGGVWYLRVAEQTTLGDVAWAGLKSPARSAEKVGAERRAPAARVGARAPRPAATAPLRSQIK